MEIIPMKKATDYPGNMKFKLFRGTVEQVEAELAQAYPWYSVGIGYEYNGHILVPWAYEANHAIREES